VESDKASEADRVKRVQHDSLLILKEVDRVCRKNGIGYFLCAGTLLGALRYKGFIPWDDDIDLGMLREDYERFLDCAPKELGESFFLQNRRTDEDVEYLFSKVRLKDTEYVTDWTRFRNQDKGISIDIFPFDKAAVEDPVFAEHARKADELVKANRYVAWHRVTEDFPHRAARNPMEAIGHVVMDMRNRPYNVEALKKTQAEYEAHVTKYNDDPTADYAVSYVTYLTYLPLRDLLPYREIEFEGGMYPAPNNPDPLMSMQFGDYMHEPPMHQRHAHAVVSWRTSDGHCG
jgi:lipopolysaccharide cholinephosphotransferase